MTPRSLALSGAALLAGTVAMTTLKPAPKPPHLLGAVLPGVTREMVCDRGYAGRVRNVPESEKAEVFRAAGIPKTARVLYEVDHIVPLAVGGANVLANLQAQLWDGPEGAHAKDRVEYLAYLKVCKGLLALEAAQAIFRAPGGWERAAKDWGLDKPRAGLMQEPDGDEEGFPR